MKIHIVQKGDTLWNLAKQYGVNFEELKAVNSHLTNPDLIMPGMKIKIPSGGVHVKKEAPKQMHMSQGKPSVTIQQKKEQPKQVQTPLPHMPHMPPMMAMPMQPTQQQMQAFDMNFNFYKQPVPPPPMVMPQVKPEYVKQEMKKEKQMTKEKGTKEEPVLSEQMPYSECEESTLDEMSPLPQWAPYACGQQMPACYPEPFVPISPIMPGCANMVAPYYPAQLMYMPQPVYPMYPTHYYQPLQYNYSQAYGQQMNPYEFSETMRMYQTPDQFEEEDDFDAD